MTSSLSGYLPTFYTAEGLDFPHGSHSCWGKGGWPLLPTPHREDSANIHHHHHDNNKPIGGAAPHIFHVYARHYSKDFVYTKTFHPYDQFSRALLLLSPFIIIGNMEAQS